MCLNIFYLPQCPSAVSLNSLSTLFVSFIKVVKGGPELYQLFSINYYPSVFSCCAQCVKGVCDAFPWIKLRIQGNWWQQVVELLNNYVRDNSAGAKSIHDNPGVNIANSHMFSNKGLVHPKYRNDYLCRLAYGFVFICLWDFSLHYNTVEVSGILSVVLKVFKITFLCPLETVSVVICATCSIPARVGKLVKMISYFVCVLLKFISQIRRTIACAAVKQAHK